METGQSVPSWYGLEPQYWIPHQELPTPSCIVALRYDAHLSMTEVYNLFSNFGNIEKIVRKTVATYVQFTNYEFAVAAK